MTDREKLLIYKKYLQECVYNLNGNAFSRWHLELALGTFNEIFNLPTYRPARPCFDKPAGVPILHGETLK